MDAMRPEMDAMWPGMGRVQAAVHVSLSLPPSLPPCLPAVRAQQRPGRGSESDLGSLLSPKAESEWDTSILSR
eukprot:2481980-Rhodomonas_salina.1